MYLPDINLQRQSAWYKDGDPKDLSLDDSQVRGQGQQLSCRLHPPIMPLRCHTQSSSAWKVPWGTIPLLRRSKDREVPHYTNATELYTNNKNNSQLNYNKLMAIKGWSLY